MRAAATELFDDLVSRRAWSAIQAGASQDIGVLRVLTAGTDATSGQQVYTSYPTSAPTVGVTYAERALTSSSSASVITADATGRVLFASANGFDISGREALNFAMPELRVTFNDVNDRMVNQKAMFAVGSIGLPAMASVGFAALANLHVAVVGTGGMSAIGTVHIAAIGTVRQQGEQVMRVAKTELGRALLRYREKVKQRGGKFRSLDEILAEIEAQRRGSTE